MICFEILINDKKVCTAGVQSKFGVLSSNLTWVRKDLNRFSDEARKTVPEEELNFDVSGNSDLGNNRSEALEWIRQSLSPGDEIKIRIKELNQADEPSSRRYDDPDLVEKVQRRYYEKLKEKYEKDV